MKFLKYILFIFLLCSSSLSYSQNLIQPAPLIRWNLLFDGVDEYCNIDNTLSVLSTTTKGTFSCWVKPVAAIPTTNEMIIGFGDTDGVTDFRFRIITDGTLGFLVRINGAVQWILGTTAAVFSDNTWVHIAITQGGIGNDPILYVNAVAVAQSFSNETMKTAWFNNAVAFLDNGRIGDFNFNSLGEVVWFNGNIDEVSLWDDDLSQPQIAEIYNNNHPTNLRAHSKYDTNNKVWYQMGEFSSFTGGNWNIIDASINNNTAVSVNMEKTDKKLTDLVYEQATGLIKVGTDLISAP